MLVAYEGTNDALAPDVVTVMATSVTHEAPLSPHAFTCTVCAPVADKTEASMDEPSMMLADIENQLKEAGLHKESPNKKFVARVPNGYQRLYY